MSAASQAASRTSTADFDTGGFSVAADLSKKHGLPASMEGVYFLTIDEETEMRIAKAWFKAHFGNVGQDGWPRIATRLPIPRITEKNIIVPLIRGEDRSPIVKQWRDVHGAPQVDRLHPNDLTSEVRVCNPVHVQKVWHKTGGDWEAFSGEIRRPEFCSALAASCTPALPRIHVGNIDELKLVFI